MNTDNQRDVENLKDALAQLNRGNYPIKLMVHLLRVSLILVILHLLEKAEK